MEIGKVGKINMAKVVYTDWKYRVEEPEIIGVYENESVGYKARQKKG